MRRFFIFFFVLSLSPLARSEWQLISDDHPQESQQFEMYIDLDTVKQSGPMAIYRQVKILSQARLGADQLETRSTQSIYEYDCMNKKLRILDTQGFTQKWAEGQKVVLPSLSSSSREWGELPENVFGKKTFDLLCPVGR